MCFWTLCFVPSQGSDKFACCIPCLEPRQLQANDYNNSSQGVYCGKVLKYSLLKAHIDHSRKTQFVIFCRCCMIGETWGKKCRDAPIFVSSGFKSVNHPTHLMQQNCALHFSGFDRIQDGPGELDCRRRSEISLGCSWRY